MGFTGVALIMMVLVLMIYLRMLDKRMKLRNREGRSEQLLIEQADTLADFGREADAIALLKTALHEKPNAKRIRARLALFQAEAEERAAKPPESR
ncbi:MAG: hypothetical protein ACX931_07975 [Saccharospirillum sp.]